MPTHPYLLPVMLDMLRKTFYAGIGASVVTTEKVESVLNEFVVKGKLSTDEARDAARKVAEESRKEYEDAQSSLKSLFEEMLSKAPVAKHSDIEQINERLDSLESMIADIKKQDS